MHAERPSNLGLRHTVSQHRIAWCHAHPFSQAIQRQRRRHWPQTRDKQQKPGQH